MNYHQYRDANDIPMLPNNILVFGSNTQGLHGAGLARVAVKWGAVHGNPRGLQGQSYAIVTKDLGKPKHPSVRRSDIEKEISALYSFVKTRPNLNFYIPYTRGGTNRSGYNPDQIFEFFLVEEPPENVLFHNSFEVTYDLS